ncbi:hypothetical protein I7I50_09927 [Histoplasma capsulatum G186AR]|uniref:Uncharacterized protein n=1 Tax=Ajellomyces capsulatus TaxID=5037 RepID=A0A8H8D621_AJECA|nr:hypothetical protein I7I52_01165 [Histoplasma capsulatum]QSS68828.1 hypothetical protein I7I50_09927 [Histoplasma capsulatum G186AR]
MSWLSGRFFVDIMRSLGAPTFSGLYLHLSDYFYIHLSDPHRPSYRRVIAAYPISDSIYIVLYSILYRFFGIRTTKNVTILDSSKNWNLWYKMMLSLAIELEVLDFISDEKPDCISQIPKPNPPEFLTEHTMETKIRLGYGEYQV